jgi:hypothetical protein
MLVGSATSLKENTDILVSGSSVSDRIKSILAVRPSATLELRQGTEIAVEPPSAVINVVAPQLGNA